MSTTDIPIAPPAPDDVCTTLEVAQRLGLAVRSVQLMVDRGELQAWKTPGGHRRISKASVERWAESRRGPSLPPAVARSGRAAPKVLLIEDSHHFQRLIGLIVRQQFPQLELHIADDGIAGLAMAGKISPDVLLVDILLPGIDGATLITGLRSHPDFARLQLIVVTSLEPEGLTPYAFALQGLPVVRKTRIAVDLPARLDEALAAAQPAVAAC